MLEASYTCSRKSVSQDKISLFAGSWKFSENTLRRWEKDYIEAKNMYFHLAYLGNRY